MPNEPENFDYELAKPVFDLADTSGSGNQTDCTTGNIHDGVTVENSPAHGRRVCNTPSKLPSEGSPGCMRGQIVSLPKLTDTSPCSSRDFSSGGNAPLLSSLQVN